MKNSKPIIGIGSDLIPSGTRISAFAYTTYIEALKQAGAVPVVVPPQPENCGVLLESLDGIVLAGGFDCDPALYGEPQHETVEAMDPRRQENDLALAKLAYELGVPTLGICLGMQVMNVARGGTLIQDIASQRPGSLIHESDPSERIRHQVEIDGDSRLARIIGAGRKTVNSSHHQAIGKAGEQLRVTALAPDGIIEAIEDDAHRFYVGVQWHPEDMEGEPSASTLFRHFVEVASRYQRERRGALVS